MLAPRSVVSYLAVLAFVIVGCGGDDDSDAGALPVVDQIAPAVEAVEGELGGTQVYFEITAEQRAVKVFVASDDGSTVTGYVYVDGELAPPGPVEPAEGFTFAFADTAFDVDTVLDQVRDEVPEAAISSFSIIGAAEGRVRYGAFADSAEGGRLDVTLSADGEVLGVGPAE